MTVWNEVELGSVMDTLKGNAFKSTQYVQKGVPIVRASDFTDNSISNEKVVFYPIGAENTFPKFMLRHWDILIQTVGSWQSNPASIVGKVVKVPKEFEGSLLNQNIVKIIPNDGVDNKFLYYRLKEDSFKFYNLGCAQGAANQASITLASIRKFTFLLPPLPTQQKIASILSAYDDLIENNLKRIKLLEEIAQRTYEEWFVKFRVNGEELAIDEGTGLPVGWEKKTLSDVLTLNYGKALRADLRIEGKYNVYGSSGVVGSHNEAIVKGPGIILGRKGNVGSVFWSSTDFFPIDTVYFISSQIGLRFLYFSLQKQNFINSDAAVPGLNRNAAYRNEILLPSTKYISMFERLATSIFDKMDNLNNQNALLKEARDLLLPRLMSGEIDVEEMKEVVEN